MMTKPLVSICMITYNHEKYIRQAIEGVLMQKTNFPIELVIGEDCSTDATRDICLEYQNKYPSQIRLLLPERNLGMHKNFINTLNECTGKYIALCEGDDYWIDPFKLQKQVDFLEDHIDYGLCHTSARIYNAEKGKFEIRLLGSAKNTFEDLLCNSCIVTLTTCFRRELLKSYIDTILPYSYNWQMGDYPLWLWFSIKSKIAFLPEVTAVYNVLAESVSHSMNASKRVLFRFSSYEIAYFFALHYLKNEKMKKIINVRFTSLVLSIIKHQTFNLFLLLVDKFSDKYDKLNICNKILFILIKKVCYIVH